MQFTGAKGITVFVATIAIGCIAGFGLGILVGRQFPTHHFEKMDNSHYLYDTSTGHVCDFWPAKAEQSDFLKSIGATNNSIPPCNQ